MVTLASLFDGIGGTPLCADMSGGVCLWASEIEKFPISVTKYHFPNMTHYGDITKINGANVPPVDIIVGGSPCQDLSIAGNQDGIRHTYLGDKETTRSGLFLEQIRIIKEMRENAKKSGNIVQPRYAIWENVLGALRSNRGDDFKTVIEEFCKIADEAISIPRPPKNKWNSAGCIMGRDFSLAWRVFDAQYWGTPQHRERIYLVVDYGGKSAPKILFESEDTTRDFEACQIKGEDTSRSSSESIGVQDKLKFYEMGSYHSNSMNSNNPHSGIYETDICRTIDCNGGNPGCNQGGLMIVQPVIYDGAQITSSVNKQNRSSGDPCPTLHTQCAQNIVVFPENSQEVYQNVVGSLCSCDFKGVNNQYVNQNKLVLDQNRVRRLTPLECERLQGFPDYWCHIPKATDTAIYKAIGNSFNIKNAFFVISRCIQYIQKGSL